MLSPSRRLFEADMSSAEYRIGVAKGLWAQAEAHALPEDVGWPTVFFWVAAAPRPGAPTRFYFRLNMDGYRSSPPSGTFWDPVAKELLDFEKFPKGRPDSRLAKVFRTDWWAEKHRAFYHPYDRVATKGHPGWPAQQPHLVWGDYHTIVDYLEEFQSLLSSGDYLGI